jgi:hypothetical protein
MEGPAASAASYIVDSHAACQSQHPGDSEIASEISVIRHAFGGVWQELPAGRLRTVAGIANVRRGWR